MNTPSAARIFAILKRLDRALHLGGHSLGIWVHFPYTWGHLGHSRTQLCQQSQGRARDKVHLIIILITRECTRTCVGAPVQRLPWAHSRIWHSPPSRCLPRPPSRLLPRPPSSLLPRPSSRLLPKQPSTLCKACWLASYALQFLLACVLCFDGLAGLLA